MGRVGNFKSRVNTSGKRYFYLLFRFMSMSLAEGDMFTGLTAAYYTVRNN